VHHIYGNQIDSAVKEILKDNPLFVGFSVLTGLPITLSVRMSKEIKKHNKNIPVVWGGIHPSLLPEQCLMEDYIDFVVMGEGEESIVELADALRKGVSLKGIKGIGYKKDGKIIINKPRELIKNIDDYEIDWSLVNVEDYIYEIWDGSRIISYITSRGCPHNCGFCYNLAFHKRRWRCFSKEKVVKRVNELIDKYNIDGITFDDDNFFTNKERALYILENIKVPTYFLDIRIDYLKDDLLKQIYKMKSRWIFFGHESGSDRILKLIDKGFTTKEIMETIRFCSRKYPDISLRANAIIGFPTETWKEVKKTIDFSLKMCDAHPNISMTFSIYTPYPGTKVYDLAIKNGFKPPKNLEGWGKYDLDIASRGEKIKIDLSWLPWMNNKKRKLFDNINKYSHLLDKTYIKGTHPLYFRLFKRLFYYIAYYRLKTRFFYFPVEFFLHGLAVKIGKNIKKI